MKSTILQMEATVERWPLKIPFRITGHTWESIEFVKVRVHCGEHSGYGEAAGVYYKGDAPRTILAQLKALQPSINKDFGHEMLQGLLPAGGARNALDCALWDLEAKVIGKPAWQLAGLPPPTRLVTTVTCGADAPETMAAAARAHASARAIKLKLTGEPMDADRVRAVREARQDVWLGIDANQGFTRAFLEQLLPTLVNEGVQLVEQPFPIGSEALLDGFQSPIPVAADESVQVLADIPNLVGRFEVVNIKLDKCGGLTEGLAMARVARELGLQVMVGNMIGTSLAMAPAFLVGQLCQIVDLDGPIHLKTDRSETIDYRDGFIMCSDRLWGYP